MKQDIKRGDILLINIPKDPNDKHKQHGRRPCIVISNDMNNKYNSRITYIPCTSSMTKAKLPTHVYLNNPNLKRDTIALCECIEGISKKFIEGRIGELSNRDMCKIEDATDIQLQPNRNQRFILRDSLQCATA